MEKIQSKKRDESSLMVTTQSRAAIVCAILCQGDNPECE